MAVQGLRLSPQQKRVWLAQTPTTAFRSYAIIRLDGAVDDAQLRAALQRVVARHEVLRTLYRRVPGVPVPLQHIQEQSDPAWTVTTGDSLGAALQTHTSTPLIPDQGPVVQATLVHEMPGSSALILSLPAVSADHVTLGNLVRDLAAAYNDELDEAGDEEVAQYADFSEWQHELLEDEDAAQGKVYWQKQGFGDVPPMNLPWAAAVSPKTPLRLERTILRVNDEGAAGVTVVAEAENTTADIVMLAAWQTLLWRLTQESRVVVGYTFSGRQHEELESAMGLFATLAPVSTTITSAMSFRDVVAQAKQAVADAGDWQEHYPWEESATPAAHTHYFPAAFEYQKGQPPISSGDITFSLEQSYQPDRADVKLTAFESDNGVTLELLYHGEAVRAADATRILEAYQVLLNHLRQAPDVRVGDVAVVTDADYQAVVTTFNDTAVEYSPKAVHVLFEAQAATAPDHVAVMHPEGKLTYAELNARANQVAHYLRRQGVGAETVVAIRSTRSPEMVVALLGVLKAGAAYVPLDMLYPKERAAFMLSDTRAPVILTQAAIVDDLDLRNIRPILLDSDWSKIAEEPTTNPDIAVEPESIAYVLYTSGSTGEPKGVLVPHRALSNYLQWATDAYDVAKGVGSPVHTPIGFDLTITSLYTSLIAGKIVVLLSDEQGVDTLVDTLLTHTDFSLLKLTPSHLDLLSQVVPPEQVAKSAHTFVVGGEQLRSDSVRFWLTNAPDSKVINEYGPTETTVGCCVYEIPHEELAPATVPIGRPIANTQMYLLDDQMRLVPLGARGEIYIGGQGVARGYMNRPRQTAERFVPNPFSDASGSRLYKTGDIARFLPNDDHTAPDVIEFLGRNDHQVKIRGYRIELDEVRAALERYPEVQDAVIVASADGLTDKRLVAYFTTQGESPMVDDIRDFMGRDLPDYMIPALFIRLERLPLTANGKVDLRALPTPQQTRPELQVAYQAPQTQVELQLAEIWGKTLGVERIGVNDSFFSLGGDSIRSVRAVALSKEVGLEYSVQALFQHPTIASLTAHLQQHTASDSSTEEDDLARMLDELESLSDEEVQNRLQTGSSPFLE